MAPYGYAFGDEAVHAFSRLSFRQRRALLRTCELLTRRPHEAGDYAERGATERIYQLKLVDDLLITWWVDDAAREIRVLRIELID